MLKLNIVGRYVRLLALAATVISLPAGSSTCASPQRVVADLPDRPVPNQQPGEPEKGKSGFSETVVILSHRSIFFPDLAYTKKPLTRGEKFLLAGDESVAPAGLLVSAMSAGISQARDSWPGYGQGWNGYGKRYGATLALNASTDVLGTFLLPSLLHEDPRYFVLAHGSFSQRIAHALTRVVVTPTDAGGRTLNVSGLLGPLGAEGLANTYLPDAERSAGQTFERFGTQLAVIAGSNVAKEFWPLIFKTLGIGKLAPGSGPSGGSPNN
ncbi:MAG TPA: hypothetical protein VKQ28_17175 [Candidatus Acidoferrum sp.]|nr:hypothetical protein [Candidatus Acidoferrum sp.]